MKRLLTLSLMLGLAVIVMAMPTFGKVFETNYKVKKDGVLDKAGCALCHAGAKGGKLNPYGTDLAAAMKTANTKKLTPDVLKAVENLDSDKDGAKNIDEIKADKHPGVK